MKQGSHVHDIWWYTVRHQRILERAYSITLQSYKHISMINMCTLLFHAAFYPHGINMFRIAIFRGRPPSPSISIPTNAAKNVHALSNWGQRIGRLQREMGIISPYLSVSLLIP